MSDFADGQTLRDRATNLLRNAADCADLGRYPNINALEAGLFFMALLERIEALEVRLEQVELGP